MYLEKIHVYNFGPVKSFNCNLLINKPNFILGDNAVGKTQIIGAIYALFHDNRVIHFNKELDTVAEISLTFNINDSSLKLKKEYSKSGSRIIFEEYDDINRCTDINKNHIFFYNNDNLSINNKLNYNYMKLIDFIEQLNVSTPELKNLFIKLYEAEKYVLLSAGEQKIIGILNQIIDMPSGAIFIGDSLFSALDNNAIKIIINIINKVKNVQFILFEKACYKLLSEHEHSFIPYIKERSIQSPVYYNYEALSNSKIKKIVSDNKQIINYRLNDTIPEEECRNVEFKEIKGKNQCNSIIKNAEIYIVSYLNSHEVADKGRILFGISDSRVVKGVPLASKDKDTIRKRISEQMNNAQPYISSDKYQIQFQEIINEEGIVENLYIVEISVSLTYSTLLFATANGEVYIKTEGGRRKLNTYEIQAEVLSRKKE